MNLVILKFRKGMSTFQKGKPPLCCYLSLFSVQPHPRGSRRLVIKQKLFVLAATDYKYDSLTSQPIAIAWGNQINRAKWDPTINPAFFSVMEYGTMLFLALEAKCLNSSFTILMPCRISYLWDFRLICLIYACLYSMLKKFFAAQRWYSGFLVVQCLEFL